MRETTPRGLRLHIAICGRRNVGKSSLLNALVGQQVAIVSPVAGTTADPVEKPMELQPLGPVVFIDTAGVDDTGDLGERRVAKTRAVFDRADLGVLVVEPDIWTEHEAAILREFETRDIPVVAAINKTDRMAPDAAVLARLVERQISWVPVAAVDGRGLDALRGALLGAVPESFIEAPTLLGDLVGPGELAVLVVPIDKEAPAGRLILPQVQAIRDLLDNDAACLVVKERELRAMLAHLRVPPKLVVTDSQAFLKVAADTPREVQMTSFSILMSRFKGDLLAQVRGAMAIDQLRTGDRVLVAEACTHHPIGEDIGRVKIPRWLTQYVGGALAFTHVQGRDFPDDLAAYKLVIHCGACMWNRRAMLARVVRCQAAGVPITNYGLTIAYSLGIFARALQPFPAALDAWRQAERSLSPRESRAVAPAGAPA